MGQRRLLSRPRPVPQGGTGLKAVPADNLVLGNGTASPTLLPLPANGQQLRSNGATWLPKAEGKILQVATFSDRVAHVVTAGSVPIWSFSLTVKKNNSRVLLMLAMVSARDSTLDTYGRYSLYRASSIPSFAAIIYQFGYPFGHYPFTLQGLMALATVDGLWLDSPGVAAGGTVAYTIYLQNMRNQSSLQTNWFSSAPSTAMLMEVGV